MQHWNTEEVDFLRQYLDESTKNIHDLYIAEYGGDRTYNSIQKKVKQLKEVYYDEVVEDTVEREVTRLLVPILDDRSLMIEKVTAQKKKENKEKIKDWLEGMIELSDEYRDKIRSSPGIESQGTSLCVLLSDTHFGKQTATFDLVEAQRRMESVPSNIKETTNANVDEVVLILAGDMVEGEDIYAGQANDIECSVIEQMQVCSESIWKTILSFREIFNCPVRVETVPGNHGRMSKTAHPISNWDNVIYHLLAVKSTMYKDNDIVVNCNFSNFRTFQVKDKVGMINHIGVKHLGTPATATKIAGWSHSKNFDFMVHGHWHEWHVGNWLGRFVMANGCMCGPDELSEQIAKEDVPRQGYFFVTPGKPIWGFSFVEWANE